MRQATRRGFIKWVAKGGLALATGMTAGFELLTHTALAYEDCSKYLPGCEGDCRCGTSQCEDLDLGEWFYCEGNCMGGCGGGPVYYFVYVYWSWDSYLGHCVYNKACVDC